MKVEIVIHITLSVWKRLKHIVWERVKVPFTTTVAFVANVDQDQAKQNVQSDL